MGTRRGRPAPVAVVLVLAAALVAAGCSGGSRATAPDRAPGLQATARAAGDRLVLGTAVRVDPLLGAGRDPRYRNSLLADFGAVTIENALKFGPVHPEPDRYDWSVPDRVVSFATEHHLLVRGHTLVWYRQLPDWVADGSWTRQRLLAVLRDHIHTVVGRYRGRIAQWDVVNEALNADGTLRDNVWLRVLGPDYIAEAFRFAHEADPDAVLFLNDFLTEGPGPKADAQFALVRRLLDEGVPVGGVGFQAHGVPTFPDGDALAAQLARYDGLGLQTAVTELDVRLPTTDGRPTADDLQAQAATYGAVTRACLRTPSCRTLAVWGFGDAESWVPSAFAGEGAAALRDEAYAPKPAWAAMQRALAEGR